MEKTRVLIFGTFDGLHKGHFDLFKQARRLARCSYLIVSVARDVNVKKIKGRKPDFSEKKRLSQVKKSKLANKVVLASKNDYLSVVRNEMPDIIALGYDQKSYVKELRKDLPKYMKGKKYIKIVRLKPYKKHIYKTSLIRIAKSKSQK